MAVSQMTLSQARTRLRYYLDDTETGDPERFSDAELGGYLEDAVSHCVRLYVSWGGTRFLEAVQSALNSSAAIDLSTYDPIDIVTASIVRDGDRYPLPYVPKGERGRAPSGPTSLTVEVMLHRHPTFPAADDEYLIGLGSTSRPSFRSLDNWVCLNAALMASVKDAERRAEIKDIEAMTAAQIQRSCGTMGEREFPRDFATIYAEYRYTYEESTQTLEVCLA